MFDIDKIREDFPILGRKVYGRRLVYLDNGATAQKPAQVLDAMDSFQRESNANIHRGIHYLSAGSTERYEQARETVREFIGAENAREIIFTSGATAAVNTVAYSFGERFFNEGDNIVVSEMEHHSNIVPWQLVCGRKGVAIRVLPFADDGRLETEKLAGLIDGRTRMVAVTQASNVLGTCPDLNEIIAVAHGAGIPVLVDGCQGIVHRKIDVRELDCDFYVFSGHKLYGPTGIGVLYGKEKWLAEMPPFMGGGDMVDRVSFSGTTWAELPLKFEAGTANYTGAIGLAEAVRYVDGIGMDEIAGHENELLAHAVERLDDLDGVRIYGTAGPKCAIVSFTAEGTHPSDIGMILDKMGVAIRTGTHCAQPLMAHYGIAGMCRASMALYNTHDEIDIFADGLKQALAMLR